MKRRSRIPAVIFILILLIGPILLISTAPGHVPSWKSNKSTTQSFVKDPEESTPLRKITLVESDPNSYLDDFTYIAGVPSSVFYHDGMRYVSPIIYATGDQSEQWLIDDWLTYLEDDGGISQAISLGQFGSTHLDSLQETIETPIYPRISGTTSAEIAAKLAVAEWGSSETVILALSKDNFAEPSFIEDEYIHQFSNVQVRHIEPTASVSSSSPVDVTFSTVADDGWLVGTFNWTGSEIFVHQLEDPNGNVVDYSLYSQMYSERSTIRVPSPLPLQFWVPNIDVGEWTMVVDPVTSVTGTVPLDCDVWLHPGFSRSITIPDNANWLNVSLSWDNAGTDLNLALIDPTGRLGQWAPAGSLIGQLGGESINLPYPMAGEWTAVVGWMNPIAEINNADLSWRISTIDSDIQPYLESASNGAALASLFNSPLLYTTENEIPIITQWAIDRLGASNCIFVDPMNIHAPALETALSSFSVFVNLSNYPSVSNMIRSISGENDIVATVPRGDGDEFFGPAAYAAAFHGAPVFSLCGDDNLILTRAEETWAPYLIGPEIEVYVQSRWTTRTENGWYDERIPNIYSMQESADEFENFISARGAYNATATQSVIIFSPTDLVKISFDRSLVSHFCPGRIPAEDSAMASVMINRGLLHRFLFRVAENADTALLTQYAYTHGGIALDNNQNGHTIYQVDDLTSSLEDIGLTVDYHIGVDAVFEALNTQVGLWSLSTHGTLTVLPTDPPERPNGIGIFSLRNEDAEWGFDTTTERDADPDGSGPREPDKLVNPYVWPEENGRHVLVTTDDFTAAVGKLGSPIIHLTACLLGGSRMPLELMELGAVGVVAAPRTVYFRAGGLLVTVFTEALAQGNTTGLALNQALITNSADYTNPLGQDSQDYGNQQVLFGDPEVHLYNPDTTPRVAALDPHVSSFDGHVPGRGVSSVAALGTSDYLPTALSELSVDYDYYEVSNFSELPRLLYAINTVIVEPGSLPSLASELSSSGVDFEMYVMNGGVLVMLGVTDDINWLSWEVDYQDGTSGTTITITDTGHPLLTTPNVLSSTVDYEGYFNTIWENFSILATDGSNPVVIAATIGSGKLALTTTNPTGSVRNQTIQNAIAWSDQNSLKLRSIELNQLIIWEGDRLIITFQLTDNLGNGISDAQVSVLMNDTEVSVTGGTNGYYTVVLTEDWTTDSAGYYTIHIYATKTGYDTLTATLIDFVFIRQSPLLILILFGGVIAAVIGGWVFMKRRRGESFTSGKSREKTEKERKRQREKDEKFDISELLGE